MRARNCAMDSENRIHADEVARKFGFRGGLVPGVVVFGYAIEPVIESYGLDWLQRGQVHIKLQQPVFEGDELLVRTDAETSPGSLTITVFTERESVCAIAEATLESEGRELPGLDDYPAKPLPNESERPLAERRLFAPGTVLGTLEHRVNSAESKVFASVDEKSPVFLGPNALVHPAVLLELANRVLMRNFRLGPWLHAASAVKQWNMLRDGTDVQVRARIADCFERKGHEFVVLDLVIAAANRVIQHVQHTAIYRPQFIFE